MITRMYKNKLFGETQRTTLNGQEMVTGFVLDSHHGGPVGKEITVPATDVTLTGNDQTCLEISKMSESELLDYVLEYPDYLSDSYYYMFGDAISKRHAELRAAR